MKNTHFFRGLIFTLLVMNPIWTYAQLGVGANNFTPNIGAMLDVSSTNKGVLLPRIPNTASLIAPTDGLLFYNTTAKKFNYFDGAAWQQTYLGSQWNVNGSNISYSAGSVGIGTTTPLGNLHIVNNALVSTPSQNVNNGAGTSITTSASSSNIYLQNNTPNSTNNNIGVVAKVTNSIGGNIAMEGLSQHTNLNIFSKGIIGETSGSSAKGIFGIANYSGNQNSAYAIYGDGFFGGWAGYFSGKVNITGVLTNPSDEKLKRNLRPMAEKESILNKIMRLQPVSYDFDKACAKFMSLPTTKQFGFTAQNIEAEFPELVTMSHQPSRENGTSEFDKTGLDYKAVNYIQLIPILTQAIQEQQEQIVKLQKQVELLLKK
jgi:hypothetical protein